jgi:hypothetical protein
MAAPRGAAKFGWGYHHHLFDPKEAGATGSESTQTGFQAIKDHRRWIIGFVRSAPGLLQAK